MKQPRRRVEDQKGLRAWMLRPARRIAVETLYALVIGMVIWSYLSLSDENRRLDTVVKRQAETRFDSIVFICEDQNRRNASVQRFLASVPPTPHARPEAAQLVKRFIDELLPVYPDCKQHARQLTQPIQGAKYGRPR